MNIPALILVLLLAGGCMMPDQQAQVAHNEKMLLAEGITALKAGDPMPSLALSLPATTGEPLVLGSAPPPAPLVLLFYPADDTPNAAYNLTVLNKALPQFEQHGIKVYAINSASQDRHAAFAAANQLSLPLASDIGGQAARAYRCLLDGGIYPQRTTVVIDPSGKIVLFQRGLAQVTLILESLGFTAAKK